MSTIDDIPLRHLRVLETVAREGGFAAAGRKLGLTRAAVSRVALQLESDVGVRLFRRTTRRVVLTDAAVQLAGRLAHSLPEIREALELASSDGRSLAGLVRVSVSHAFGRHYVLPSVARFVAAQPAIRIDLKLEDHIDDLVDEPIDVAVRMGPLLASSLIARSIGRLSTLLVAAPALLVAAPARRTARALRELAELPAVGFRIPGKEALVPWSFESEGRALALAPSRIVVTSDSIEGVVDLARLGVGAAFVPRYLVENDLASGALVALAEGAASSGPEVHLCFLDRQLLPPRVRAVVGYLGDDLRKALRRE